MQSIISLLEGNIQGALHVVAQALMIPVMIVLVLLILMALFFIGSVLVEYFTERRHFARNEARDINAIYDAPYQEVAQVVARTSLLGPQKEALEVVARNMGLSDDDLFALAKSEVQRVDERYQRSVKRTDLITKIAPMMGLMCTLIPLGPGIVAMGQGDTETLSNSLLVAFDGTVAGLFAAVVAMVVSNIRKRWYGKYTGAIEALMTSILSKADDARKAGVVLPHNFTPGDLARLRREQGKTADDAADGTAAPTAEGARA